MGKRCLKGGGRGLLRGHQGYHRGKNYARRGDGSVGVAPQLFFVLMV